LEKLALKIKTKKFKNSAKNNPEDFTRERKLGFLNVMTMTMNMMKKTLQIEIDDFLKRFNQNHTNEKCSKQAFSQARQKLKPVAFRILNDTAISEFYKDDDFKKYKGYRLLGIDGSIFEIPDNPKTRAAYGYAANGQGTKIARALSSTLYDVENGLIISSKLDKYTSSERVLAKENIEKMLSLNSGIKTLLLADRGVPSLDMILYLQEKGIDFLMRTNSQFFKEVVEAKEKDQIVEIVIDEKRYYHFLKKGVNVKLGQIIKLRVLKIELDNGEIETLITNLSPEILSYDEAKSLYFKRWGIETKFDDLKNKLQIENFSSPMPLIIEQEYYASMLMSNLASLIRQDAEEELIEKNKGKELKHEYKINQNILYGKLKYNLIELLLEENDDKKTLMYNQLLKDIKRNIVPIRKDRHFERKKGPSSNKYAMNRRFAL
jgi:hypothetical protein